MSPHFSVKENPILCQRPGNFGSSTPGIMPPAVFSKAFNQQKPGIQIAYLKVSGSSESGS